MLKNTFMKGMITMENNKGNRARAVGSWAKAVEYVAKALIATVGLAGAVLVFVVKMNSD